MYTIKCFLIIINNKYVSKLYFLRFSVNNLRQNVGFMHDHKMCVLIFSTTSVRNTFHSCTTLMTLEFSVHIFEKYSNIKFHENPSNVSPVVPHGRPDGRTDITKLIVAFHNFVDALKNHTFHLRQWRHSATHVQFRH